MNDRQRQQLVEQCEEAELTLLMYDYAREEGRQLAKEYDEAQKNGTLPEIPEELDRKCRALIDGAFAKMERKTRLKRIVRSAAKAAAVLFVVLGVMATTVMSVDALRVPVVNFLLDSSSKFGSVIFANSPEQEKIQNHSILCNFIDNIPEGYNVTLENTSSDIFGTICAEDDENNLITLEYYPSSGEYLIDTENITSFEMQIGEFYVTLVNKEGCRAIWLNSETEIVYSVYSNGLDENNFVKLLYAVIG